VLLVDESFTTIVRFYVPALLLFLAAATIWAFRGAAGWTLITFGLALSAGAALLQQLRIALHPVYFDHNAVYHVVQAAALVLLYLGFRRVAGSQPERNAVGADPGPRSG
jgi:ABC-type long-subunit fatty acid transport system fused permease/ATPase subunit